MRNRCRELLPYAIAALLVLAPSAARGERGFEITPFAGFRFGGSFEDKTTGTDFKVGESGSFGVILGLRDTPETHYELFYSFQRTELDGGGIFGGAPMFDLDIHYLHLGGTYEFPGEKKVIPFISGGIAVTFLVPRCRPGFEHELLPFPRGRGEGPVLGQGGAAPGGEGVPHHPAT